LADVIVSVTVHSVALPGNSGLSTIGVQSQLASLWNNPQGSYGGVVGHYRSPYLFHVMIEFPSAPERSALTLIEMLPYMVRSVRPVYSLGGWESLVAFRPSQ